MHKASQMIYKKGQILLNKAKFHFFEKKAKKEPNLINMFDFNTLVRLSLSVREL
jgi:hypothetical protein